MRKISLAQLEPKQSKAKQLQKPKPKVDKPPKVEVEVKQIEAAAPIINIDMSKFTEDNTAALQLIADAIKVQQPTPAAKPTEWQFDIQRDEKGFIKGMTATAK